MAVQQLGNERTTIYADGLDLVFERIFDAPRDLVWTVITDPDRMTHWWGPAATRPRSRPWTCDRVVAGGTSPTRPAARTSRSAANTSRSIRPPGSSARSASTCRGSASRGSRP